jgi:hypothetical protein
MKTIKQQLHAKRLWLFLTILIGLLTFYCTSFWHVPLSEDAGLYGYFSRAIANGMVLHKDTFLSSNSIAIYVTALIFRFAGSSLDLYRLIHAVGLFSLVLAIYFIVSKGKNYGRGFLAASLAGIFSVLPHIILDLGRNYIVWATGFLLVGFSIQSSNIKRKEIYSGVLLGIAALIRETFVLAGIGLLAYEIGRLAFHKEQKGRDSYRPVLVLGTAFLLTLSLNAIILTYYGTWGGYLRDMLQSGTSFRYQSGLLDPTRIQENLSQLRTGFSNFYSPLLLLALLSYFIAIKDGFVSYVKFLLVPVFVVEVIVVNKTSSYSIIPILVFASILSSYLVFELRDVFTRSRQFRVFTLKVVAFALVLPFVAIGIVNCTLNTAREFHAYYNVAQEMSNTKLSDSNEHTSRILYVVDLLPHATVSTNSEYPFLLLAKKFYGTSPFVEDLSASANLNRPDIWEAQLESIKRTPPDLLISKTTGSYLSKWTDLGEIADEDYIIVYDFPFAALGPTPYKERVSLSKNAFYKSYTLWKEETAEGTFEGFNDCSDGIIVSVSTSLPEDIKTYSITAKLSKVQYAEEYTNDLVIYSLVPPKSEFKIETANGTPMNQQFQITYYIRNELE